MIKIYVKLNKSHTTVFGFGLITITAHHSLVLDGDLVHITVIFTKWAFKPSPIGLQMSFFILSCRHRPAIRSYIIISLCLKYFVYAYFNTDMTVVHSGDRTVEPQMDRDSSRTKVSK